ncbi:MAG: InlB B-repeat-containing protein [Bacilli bacterium]|nr:InlB B-repeat-containing protein [Bacilli bacterium]
MKNKGFTLIEVLSIIVILGIVAVIILPNIGGSTATKKQNEYNKLVTIVENAAKSYHSSNRTLTKIDVSTLVENKLLTSGLTDEEGNPVSGCVKITKDTDGFNVYKYYKNCSVATVALTVTKNGGDTTQVFNATYQEGDTLLLEDATRSGYEFTGWQLVRGDSTLNNNTLVFGSTDTEIYATWKSYPTLTVDTDGGTLAVTPGSSYPTGYQLDLGAPTKTGYSFVGWQVISGNSIVSGTNITIGTENTTIKAIWSIAKYTIVLSSPDATTPGSSSVQATYNGSVGSITAPVRSYTVNYAVGSSGASLSKTSDTATYTLKGWYTQPTGGTKVLNANGTLVTNVSGYSSNGKWIYPNGTTLYAQWTSASVTTAKITRSGYTCNYTNGVGSNVTYTPTSSITLTATCSSNTTCSTGYSLVGDSCVDNIAPVVSVTKGYNGIMNVSVVEEGSGVDTYAVTIAPTLDYAITPNKMSIANNTFVANSGGGGTWYVRVSDKAGNVGTSPAVIWTLADNNNDWVTLEQSEYDTSNVMITPTWTGSSWTFPLARRTTSNIVAKLNNVSSICYYRICGTIEGSPLMSGGNLGSMNIGIVNGCQNLDDCPSINNNLEVSTSGTYVCSGSVISGEYIDLQSDSSIFVSAALSGSGGTGYVYAQKRCMNLT